MEWNNNVPISEIIDKICSINCKYQTQQICLLNFLLIVHIMVVETIRKNPDENYTYYEVAAGNAGKTEASDSRWKIFDKFIKKYF